MQQSDGDVNYRTKRLGVKRLINKGPRMSEDEADASAVSTVRRGQQPAKNSGDTKYQNNNDVAAKRSRSGFVHHFHKAYNCCTRYKSLHYDYGLVSMILFAFLLLAGASVYVSWPHDSFRDYQVEVTYSNFEAGIYSAVIPLSRIRTHDSSADVFIYYSALKYLQPPFSYCVEYSEIKHFKSENDALNSKCSLVQNFFNDDLTYEILDSNNVVLKPLRDVELASNLSYDGDVIKAEFPKRSRILRWLEISIGREAFKLLGSIPKEELKTLNESQKLRISGQLTDKWKTLLRNPHETRKLAFRVIQENSRIHFTHDLYFLILSATCLGLSFIGLVIVLAGFCCLKMTPVDQM